VVKEAVPVATLSGERIFCIKDVTFIPFKHKFLYRVIDQTENEKILE
jgi:hypothetical protein